MEFFTEEELKGATVIDRAYAHTLLPKRKRNSHKGSYGKAAIVAGSADYLGAAYLAAAACLRSGAGYTYLFVPKGVLPAYRLKLPEAILKPINGRGRYAFNAKNMAQLLGFDSVAYGMGMGVSKQVARGARWLLERYEGKLILDADGLNSLAKYEQKSLSRLFKEKKCSVLITPHIKEFSRLTGKAVEEIAGAGISLAKAFAVENDITVLLKNAATVITDGTRVAVNTAGCSGQAKGGSGDVLSGVVAGLCAMGASVFDAGALGAYLTGTAAELTARELGEYSMLASDVIAHLGGAFLLVTEDTNECSGENEQSAK